MEDTIASLQERINYACHSSLSENVAIVTDQSQAAMRRVAALIAITASTELQVETKLSILLQVADDPNIDIRKMGISFLGNVRHLKAIEKLRTMVWNDDRFIQALALEALAKLGDVSIFGPCCHLLSHGDNLQRTVAVKALALMGTEQSETLIQMLLSSEEERSIKTMAAMVVAFQGNHVGEELLERELINSEGFECLLISCALICLRNRNGLSSLKKLIQSEGVDDYHVAFRCTIQDCIRLDLESNPENWKNEVLLWIDEQLK